MEDKCNNTKLQILDVVKGRMADIAKGWQLMLCELAEKNSSINV